MSSSHSEQQPDPAPTPPTEPQGLVSLFKSSWQFVLSLLIAVCVLVFLLLPPQKGSTPVDGSSTEAVRMVGPGLVRVQPGTPLDKKLVATTVTHEKVSAPLLTVTGYIVARLPPGKDSAEGRWDFHGSELATAYADWLKARAEVPFADKQLATIRDLATAKVTAQTKVVNRLEKLVQAGTDSQKDLDAAKADLLNAKLQGQKDVHEAETALKTALRTQATLERQLFQAGIDPELLVRNKGSSAIVVAEVPEARVGLAQPGQACVARFYAFPGTVFSGRVGSLAPTLSKERRTLRVFFELDDPQGRLKPGMFADIGLGTDARETLLAPADGVVHVGRSDYLLVATAPGVWRITEVKTGESHGTLIEILEGLKGGDRVIGAGAILMKPFIVQAVKSATDGHDNWSPAREKKGS